MGATEILDCKKNWGPIYGFNEKAVLPRSFWADKGTMDNRLNKKHMNENAYFFNKFIID
jgi:hypothetical protein